MTDQKIIHIEIAYATPKKQIIKKISAPSGITIEQAIEQSGIKEEFKEIDLTQQKVGIFSKSARLDTKLRNKDRVEIYRKLIADPKESRRAKLAKKGLKK